jgi:hypothetical protein
MPFRAADLHVDSRVRVCWRDINPSALGRDGVDKSGYGAWTLSPIPSYEQSLHWFDFDNLASGATYHFYIQSLQGTFSAAVTLK